MSDSRVVEVLQQSIAVIIKTAHQTHDRKLLALLFRRLADGLLSLAVGAGDLAGLLIELHDKEVCQRYSSQAGEFTRSVAGRVLELGGPGQAGAPVEALLAYPLLAPYLRTLECWALLELAVTNPDLEPNQMGHLQKSSAWPLRGPFWNALARLRGAWNGCFPKADPGPALPRYVALAEDLAFSQAFAQSPGAEWQRYLSREATALGFYKHWLEKVEELVGWKGRLQFWKPTPDKARAKLLSQLKQRAHNACKDGWQGMLEAARRTALQLPGPAAYLAVSRLSRHIDEIDFNNKGEVTGREPAQASLRELEERFRRFYSLPATLGALLKGLQDPADPVCLKLRQDLEGIGKLHLFYDWLAIHSEHNRTTVDQRSVGAGVPVWDRINVFKQTPAKRMDTFLRTRVSRLQEESEQVLDELLGAVGEVFPPLGLFLKLASLHRCLDGIRVETDGERDPQTGEMKTVRKLQNKERARAYLASWNKEFVEVYGSCGLCDLLETAELCQGRSS